MEEESQLPRRARKHENRTDWGILHYTAKLDSDGAVRSYQMICKNPAHGRCSKTKAVHLCASEEQCLRMLKTWAILGKPLLAKKAHADIWDDVVESAEFGDLPSMEICDNERIENYDL